ncbi:hypothetical protein DHD32_16210 [Arenibacter sp. TNZ]|uniref:hypothetical protein n=1 Tax=Arenibacter TaxID=178469 RepID=UPI000CD40D0B|nr:MULTISPECIES: hypothetical protein [Arenibacter]MCM4173029.1 hypothetical protein [Arenibacter sp. TNZ]
MKINTNVFLIFSILLFFACSNDNANLSESDKAQALLGQWEYESIMTDRAVDINGDGTSNIDLFNTQEIKQCIKDNLTFFAKRGEGEKGAYNINENGLACDGNQAFTTIETDSYELINNNRIVFDTRNEMKIMEFTKNKLVVETEDNLDGTDVLVTIILKKS